MTIGQFNQVSVHPVSDASDIEQGRLTCTVGPWKSRGGRYHRCKARAMWLVFNDDGATVMSRLYASPCSSHLEKGVRNAHDDNRIKAVNKIIDGAIAQSADTEKARF